MHYILQTSAVSITTETVNSHENVLLPRLVKTAEIVCLGTHRTSLEILSMDLVFVSNNNRLYTVCEQILLCYLYSGCIQADYYSHLRSTV